METSFKVLISSSLSRLTGAEASERVTIVDRPFDLNEGPRCRTPSVAVKVNRHKFVSSIMKKGFFLIKMFTLHMEKFLFLPLGRP